jgi:hypothetical protein
MDKLETIVKKVLSYVDIPEELVQNSRFQEHGTDVYIDYKITPVEERYKYSDDWSLDDWIIENYPELISEEFLIHIDY